MKKLTTHITLIAVLALITLTVGFAGWRAQAAHGAGIFTELKTGLSAQLKATLLGRKAVGTNAAAAPVKSTAVAAAFATITVTNTNDSGAGSLRQAILDSNASVGVFDTIEFNLGAGTPTISPLSQLPTITDPVTINGTTGGATRVELNGAGAGGGTDGLVISAGNSTIAGLVINRFGDYGIVIERNGGNTIRNCYIGTGATGMTDLGNDKSGVFINDTNGNTIGGTTAADRNIISGNGRDGVAMDILSNLALGANQNRVIGNYIGTDATGLVALGNTRDGVLINRGDDNTIGGNTAGERNVISGNGRLGIYLLNSTATAIGNKVIGNYIGRNATDTADLGNGLAGVSIEGAANNTIGGTSTAERNIISGNITTGVTIFGGAPTSGNAILGNSIFNNGNLGIELVLPSGVNPNDAGDGDTGANGLQNFPVLTCATSAGGSTTIGGTLNSLATTAFRIEYFVNDACDASGNGEGQTFLGTQNVTTDGSGNVTLNATGLPSVAVGKFITATATRLDAMGDPVETSEFSACLAVNAPPTLAISDVTMSEGNSGTTNFVFTVTLTGAQTNCLPVTVAYATANGSATAGSDYTTTSGTLTFSPPHASNSVTQTITVPVTGDAAVEPNETFFVNISSPTNATITDNQGLGTITNDDTCPTQFTVNDLGDAADATPGDYLCATAGGVCTLRAAIQEANAIPACSPLTINFSVTGVINLATALPNLNHPNLTINGPGANQLDVHRNVTDQFRIFTVNSGKIVNLSGLTVSNGDHLGQAGGIQNNGTLTMTDCVVSGNRAPQGGGLQNDGVLTMTGCTFSENTALTDYGGGLLTIGSTTLTNCTFSGNSSNYDGGGLFIGGTGQVFMTNCTVTNNTALHNGGGLSIDQNPSNNATLKNNIIAGNRITGTPSILTPNLFANSNFQPGSTNNLLGAGHSGGLTNGVNGNQLNVANALLAPLANYGGTTQTHALLPGSLALNAGTNTGAPATDQRGIARPQQTTTDIGAYESRGFTLAVNSGNNQTTNINTAFSTPLKVNVTPNNAGEPVDGGQVTFTPPVVGASATLATSPATIASGMASVTATANATVGSSYDVIASALGAPASVNFALTNIAQPTIAINDVIVTEGNAGMTAATFMVRLSKPSTQTITVSAASANGTATTADGDYAALAATTITFNPGETSKTVTVNVKGDVMIEGNEIFFVNLTNPINATISDGQGQGTITNDDLPPLTAQMDDPFVCNGIGSSIQVTATLTNPNTTPALATFNVNLPATLTVVAGTCTASIGACTPTPNTQVAWAGTIPALTTLTIQYQAQIADGTPDGTTIVINSTGSVADVATSVSASGTVTCPATSLNAEPNDVAVSDQKAGSVLVFPYYNSKSVSQTDTRLSLANVGSQTVYVHLFFIEGASCYQADFTACITPNGALTFKASEVDPETTGWLMAVAVDANGQPVQANNLIGNAFVRDGQYVGNYSAESFWAHSAQVATVQGNSATLRFDGTGYDAVPNQFAVEIQSPHDAVGQKIVTVGMNGDLTEGQITGASQIGPGLVYNGNEKPFGSFQNWLAGTCQATAVAALNSPRVPNTLGGIIPSGQTGTIKLNIGSGVGILLTPQKSGGWSGLRGLHKTSTTFTTIKIPVIMPQC